MGLLDILAGLTRGDNAAVSENPKLLPGGPGNFFQLFSKIPIVPTLPPDFSESSRVHSTADAPMVGAQAGSPKQSFWANVKNGSSPLGSTIQSLLGTLALGGVGAGIGAIASPGARGLGAARGFGVGAVKGIDQDLAMRKSAAQIPSNLLNEQMKAMQLQQAAANLEPGSHREYSYAKNDPAYMKFLKDRQENPLSGLKALAITSQLSNQKLDNEMAFRKEFSADPIVKESKLSTLGIQKIRNAANSKKPTGFDDQALIFNFQKVLDPGSVVREGEYKVTAGVASFLDGMGIKVNKVLSGQQLSPDQRAKLLDAAEKMYAAGQDKFNEYRGEMEGIAAGSGFDPRRVLPNFGQGPAKQSGKAAQTLSKQDQEAINWAKLNPKDPRAAKILQLHGAQ